MSTLENIIENGNRPPLNPDAQKAGVGSKRGPNHINCADGFTVSVIAGDGTYCFPRPESLGLPYMGDVGADFTGPFHEVEVGMPSERPEPWDKWEEHAEDSGNPTGTVYGYVPVRLVRDLVALHGGEA